MTGRLYFGSAHSLTFIKSKLIKNNTNNVTVDHLPLPLFRQTPPLHQHSAAAAADDDDPRVQSFGTVGQYRYRQSCNELALNDRVLEQEQACLRRGWAAAAAATTEAVAEVVLTVGSANRRRAIRGPEHRLLCKSLGPLALCLARLPLPLQAMIVWRQNI